jgi:hypothetical protein
MHLAYSALRPQNAAQTLPENQTEIQLRYRAYSETCNKFSHHINEIQKYLPGWMPPFRQSKSPEVGKSERLTLIA